VRGLGPGTLNALLAHDWPGNVRELENAMERACVTARGSAILPENLPPELSAPAAPKLPFHIDLDRKLPDLLREIEAHLGVKWVYDARHE
jgi:DNA-binding NtrC family response regulator